MTDVGDEKRSISINSSVCPSSILYFCQCHLISLIMQTIELNAQMLLTFFQIMVFMLHIAQHDSYFKNVSKSTYLGIWNICRIYVNAFFSCFILFWSIIGFIFILFQIGNDYYSKRISNIKTNNALHLKSLWVSFWLLDIGGTLSIHLNWFITFGDSVNICRESAT